MAASLAALTPDIDVATLTRITAQPLPARRIAEELRTRYHYHDAELVHLLHVLVARGALVVDSAQRTLERQSCAEGAFSTAQ
jgi:hypothetical protein